MSEPVVIFEDWSPCCDIQAFVEESDTCCYFYLWVHPGRDNAYFKSCWICNTASAPKQLDIDAMQDGNAPAYDLIRSLDDRTEEALEHVNCPIERLVIFDGEAKLK